MHQRFQQSKRGMLSRVDDAAAWRVPSPSRPQSSFAGQLGVVADAPELQARNGWLGKVAFVDAGQKFLDQARASLRANHLKRTDALELLLRGVQPIERLGMLAENNVR